MLCCMSMFLLHVSIHGLSADSVVPHCTHKPKAGSALYIGMWAKAPNIPLYDDGQYRVAAQ
jgi:hypothetical protein